MSTYTLIVTDHNETRQIPLSEGQDVLSALREAGYTQVSAPCGGRGICKQCRVMLDGKQALACKSVPDSDCSVILPDSSKMDIVTTGAGDIPPGGEGLGVAVDIGTTTVAAYMYDLRSGKLLNVRSERNAQRAYGADVISRIQYSGKNNGLERLQNVIRQQISGLMDALLEDSGKARGEIIKVTVAGNTVMEHLFCGLDPTPIGVSPFTPRSFFGEEQPTADVFPGLAEVAVIYLCPAVSGYVGGDITAGLLSSGAYTLNGQCLFIDIGTNGEMAIGGRDGFLCCATAAGPAFEGAEIECGMDGSVGAISKVSYVNHQIEFSAIGNVEATGICGSGLVDGINALLKAGIIEASGRMVPPDEAPGHLRSQLERAQNGQMRFYFTPEIYISAADVREIQLAKSAIRAGIETLLELKGLSYDQVDMLLIAGGFGAYLDVDSACGIGLLPPAFLGRTAHIGNSAGAGAALVLDPESVRTLDDISSGCEYIELSSSAEFMSNYLSCMVFDEDREDD